MMAGLDDVASLLAPLSIDSFVERYWGQRPVHSGPAPARLSLLAERLVDCDVESVIASVRTPIHALVPDTHGNKAGVLLSGVDAAKVLDSGIGLFLTDVAVVDWLRDALSETFGLDPARMRGQAFITRLGERTGFHFDAADNFTIQLRGRKRWHLSKNDHVRSPMANYLLRDQIDGDMRFALRTELPTTMTGSTTLELEPGSLLYLPRGYWHATDTIEDYALSVSVSYYPQTWLDLVAERLRTLLISREPWRERVPIAALRGRGRRREALGQLSSLLRELSTLVGETAPDDVLRDPADLCECGNTTRFRRNPFACVNLRAAGTERTVHVVVFHRGVHKESTTEVELTQHEARLVDWVMARPVGAAFGEAEVLSELQDSNIKRGDISRLVNLLCAAGLLSPIEDAQDRDDECE